MKRNPLLMLNLCLFAATSAQADIVSDAEEIMNRGQQIFPQFFPSSQTTQTLPPWLFRYYPETGVYLGINQNDAGVYLMGGVFGNEPSFFASTGETLGMLRGGDNQTQKGQACNINSLPTGISVTQNGNTTNISTNGQCIKISEQQSFCEIPPETDNSGTPVATGIHMVTQVNLQTFEFGGINFSNDMLASMFKNQLQNSFSAKTCVIHAPEQYNYTVNFDMCLDVTDQFTEMSDLGTINPPVTVKYLGNSSSSIVPDCFNTDSTITTNLVTNEIWMNLNGTWQKIQ
ncbi:MAG: hypothetical protein Kow0065_18070 [Methylomicrobium sp.]